MKILQKSQAGTFESSDVLILIEPVEEKSGRKLEISSSVILQYGERLKNIINAELDKYEINDIHMIVNDKGALEPTIYARLETAIKRACNLQKGTL
jgi:citrate lyase subunit gamma (acyl carrier protein)